jgi:Rieske Fe-S protein
MMFAKYFWIVQSPSPSFGDMRTRRVFLKVLGAAAAGAGAASVGCGGESSPGDEGGESGAGSGAGGSSSGSTSGAGPTGPTGVSSGGGTAVTSGTGGGLPSHLVPAGNVADLAVGELRGVAGQKLVAGRDEAGVYAMTSVCTHKLCDMLVKGVIDATGLYCKCHKSKFDTNGGVLQGPATKALAHYFVMIDGAGNIGIDPAEPVDAAFRAPVG